MLAAMSRTIVVCGRGPGISNGTAFDSDQAVHEHHGRDAFTMPFG